MKKISFSIMVVLLILYSLFSANFALSDIDLHWANNHIRHLVSIRAVNGYPDGTFKPDNNITRAEFTALLLRALKIDPGNSETGYWADNFINEAVSRGYIKKGEFDDVRVNITRGEIARMVVRAMDEKYPVDIAELSVLIKDFNDTSHSYREFVLKAFNKGIITGRPDGSFGYKENATRAEAVTMAARLIDESKRIIPFVEPEIGILTNMGNLGKVWYEISIDNIDDYSDDYKYRIEMITFPELNIQEIKRPDGSFEKKDIREWKTTEEIKNENRVIHRFMTDVFSNERPFHIPAGTEVEYRLTVIKSSLEREYAVRITLQKDWQKE